MAQNEKSSRVSITEKVIIPGYSLYNGAIPKEVTMRAMTTIEEKMRLSGTNSDVLTSIIKSCIVEPEDINVGMLKLQDVQYLMYRLRSITYGSDYHVGIICPHCGRTNELVINLDELEVKLADDLVEPFEFTLPRSGDVVEFKILSSDDYSNIRRDAARIRAKMPDYVGDPEYMLTYQYKITKVNGDTLIPGKLQQFVENMLASDASKFDLEYDRIASSFGMNTTVVDVCNNCGNDFTYNIPVTSEFFRPTH